MLKKARNDEANFYGYSAFWSLLGSAMSIGYSTGMGTSIFSAYCSQFLALIGSAGFSAVLAGGTENKLADPAKAAIAAAVPNAVASITYAVTESCSPSVRLVAPLTAATLSAVGIFAWNKRQAVTSNDIALSDANIQSNTPNYFR